MTTDPRASRRDEGRLLAGIVGALFVVFVFVNLSLSRFHGHLAMIPIYDDINYMADALSRLRFDAGSGLRSVLQSFIAEPPHAPVTTATGMLGFWLFGPEPLSAYIANSWVVLLFLAFVTWLSRPLGATLDRAMFVALFLFVPVVQALVMEFRPDLPGGLIVGLTLFALCSADLARSSLPRRLGLAALCVASTVVKPSAFVLVVPLLGLAFAILILRSLIFERAERRANLVAIVQIGVAYLLLMVPFALIWGEQTYDYVYGALFTYADVWRSAGDKAFHLLYNSTGIGGAMGLGRFLRYGLALIVIDLAIWALRRGSRARGVVEYDVLLVAIYFALASSGEKTVYQGGFFYLPFVIGFAAAGVRILVFLRERFDIAWIGRPILVVILAIFLYKLPLASYYYGADPNAYKLPPIVERTTTRLGDIALANRDNPACKVDPLTVVFTDAFPIPTELVRFEAARIGLNVKVAATFMMRDVEAMKRSVLNANVIMLADPSHVSTSRWLPGLVHNAELFDALKGWGAASRYDVGSPDGTPLYIILNPRCTLPPGA